jgi:hypothetical protein
VPAAFGSAGMLGIVIVGRHFGLATKPNADIALSAGSCAVVCILGALAHLRGSKRHDSLYGARTPESAAAL